MPEQISEELKQWQERIDLGVTYKKRYGNSDDWETYRRYYRGYFPGYSSSTSKVLPYNITYAMARTLIPNIYFRNPYINITPRYKMGSPIPLDIHAKVVESVDNWLMQEMSVKKEMKTALLDCFFTNRGIWKIGYDSMYGFAPKLVEEELGIGDTTLTQYSKRKGEAIEYNINVKPGMPWVLRIDPDDIIVPFGARTLDECPWICHRVIRPLEDIKADAKYTNTRDLTGTHLEQIYKDSKKMDFYKHMTSISNWVEIFEVRDRKRKEIFAFVYGYGYIREPEEDILQIEGLPYVDITFNEDTQLYWGPSDCAIMEPQQLEVNEARTQAMLHRRVALLKFLVDENVITQDEIDKMISENVAPVIRIKGSPGPSVTQLQPHIPADLVQWVEVIRSDVRELIGMSRQAAGEIPAGRRTAREVDIATIAKEIRLDERRDMLADALVDIVRKVNQIIFKRWDTRHIVQVVGYDAARYWIEYTGEAITGEYNVRVDVESMTPTTKALKKREIVELIGALSKYPRANIDYLMRMLLREFDYIDALQLLPEAPEAPMGQPMPVEQFVDQQQGLLQSPAHLAARTRRAQQMVGAMM